MYKDFYDKDLEDYFNSIETIYTESFNRTIVGLPTTDLQVKIKELKIKYEAKKKHKIIKDIINDL